MATTTTKKAGGTFILRAGQPVEVGLRIKTMRETGYEFPSRMRTETRLIINHATGAENYVAQVYENMMRHKSALGQLQPLSVHFIIDQKGTIYQTADADARCAHCAGSYRDFSPNAVSIGIEIVGRLTDWRKVPNKGVVRPRMKETIHGVEMDVDEMLPAQCEAAAQLNEVLCAMYKLPLRVPEEDKSGAVRLETLSQRDAEAFTGCAGHLHFASKPDPGRLVLRAIQERGRALSK